jgi:hypothetical protein
MVNDYIKDVLGGFAEEKTIDDLFWENRSVRFKVLKREVFQ